MGIAGKTDANRKDSFDQQIRLFTIGLRLAFYYRYYYYYYSPQTMVGDEISS